MLHAKARAPFTERRHRWCFCFCGFIIRRRFFSWARRSPPRTRALKAGRSRSTTRDKKKRDPPPGWKSHGAERKKRRAHRAREKIVGGRWRAGRALLDVARWSNHPEARRAA